MTMNSQASDSNSSSEESNAFALLHPLIQKWVWNQDWNELRDVQEKAAKPILSAKQDVIISAATASGKTEAAFLSICTVLLNSRFALEEKGNKPPKGVKVLYISPLKALINDQYNRLDAFCESLEIPVHRWHGDVSASHKKKAVEVTEGILLITPESLEAMFVNKGSSISSLFSQLSYIVIDELHAFIGSERGSQLQSLMHRVERVVGHSIPRIGLSATLGNMIMASDFLRPGSADKVELIISTEDTPAISLQLRGYIDVKPKSLDDKYAKKEASLGHGVTVTGDSIINDSIINDSKAEEAEEDINGSAETKIASDLFRVLRNSDNLIFANSRKKVERYSDMLSRMCEDSHLPNSFMPHHGNLDKSLREEVEARLKDRSAPLTAVCTSTLELGIDIGSVNSIAQVGPPPSVSSLRQRLGRSGRRGSPATLRLYITESELESDSPLYAKLRVQLVQSIAMVNLLMNRFNESPNSGGLHLSTLVQQLLSLIAQYGGVTATQAYQLLCSGSSSPFNLVTQEDFIELLKQLGQSAGSGNDYIMQSSDGTLLLGTTGERVVSHYSFYTAFNTPEEYRLISNGKQIGTYPVEQMIVPDSLMIFAGRRWKVLSVDEEKKVIELAKARGGKLPDFGGEEIPVSAEVRQEMWRVYNGGSIPVYLNSTAKELLKEARRNFRLHRLGEEKIIDNGGDALLFGWAGDLEMSTLAVMLMQTGTKVGKEGMYLNIEKANRIDAEALLTWVINQEPPTPESLAMLAQNKIDEKYDHLLSERLLNMEYAKKNIRVDGAIALAKTLVGWEEA